VDEQKLVSRERNQSFYGEDEVIQSEPFEAPELEVSLKTPFEMVPFSPSQKGR